VDVSSEQDLVDFSAIRRRLLASLEPGRTAVAPAPPIRYFGTFNFMPTKVPITVAHGDGIGPEIMNATIQVLQAASAGFDIESIEIGEKVYLRGNAAGKVWPQGMAETFCNDSFRCRFEGGGGPVTQDRSLQLLDRVGAPGLEVVKTESLRTFDGKAGFSLAQGQ
jgi:hypothetical protein